MAVGAPRAFADRTTLCQRPPPAPRTADICWTPPVFVLVEAACFAVAGFAAAAATAASFVLRVAAQCPLMTSSKHSQLAPLSSRQRRADQPEQRVSSSAFRRSASQSCNANHDRYTSIKRNFDTTCSIFRLSTKPNQKRRCVELTAKSCSVGASKKPPLCHRVTNFLSASCANVCT